MLLYFVMSAPPIKWVALAVPTLTNSFTCGSDRASSKNAIAVVRSAFTSLRNVPADDIVLMANLPDHTLLGPIEISRGVWEHVRPIVSMVTVVRKSGASPVASENAAAVIDRCLSSDEEAREVLSLKMTKVQSSGP